VVFSYINMYDMLEMLCLTGQLHNLLSPGTYIFGDFDVHVTVHQDKVVY
jgi:hypothetical protein